MVSRQFDTKTLTRDPKLQSTASMAFRDIARHLRDTRERSATLARCLRDIVRCFRDASSTFNMVFGGIRRRNFPTRNARDSKLPLFLQSGHFPRKKVSQRAVFGGFALWHLFPWTWCDSLILDFANSINISYHRVLQDYRLHNHQHTSSHQRATTPSVRHPSSGLWMQPRHPTSTSRQLSSTSPTVTQTSLSISASS